MTAQETKQKVDELINRMKHAVLAKLELNVNEEVSNRFPLQRDDPSNNVFKTPEQVEDWHAENPGL